MLNLPWVEVIAVTMSLLHLYCTQIVTVPKSTVFLTSASHLWYLLYTFIQWSQAGGKAWYQREIFYQDPAHLSLSLSLSSNLQFNSFLFGMEDVRSNVYWLYCSVSEFLYCYLYCLLCFLSIVHEFWRYLSNVFFFYFHFSLQFGQLQSLTHQPALSYHKELPNEEGES